MEMEKTVIISGGTGLIGSEISRQLSTAGYHVYILTRTPQSQPGNRMTQVYWDPMKGKIDTEALPAAPFVYNLAGAPIVGKRWSPEYQQLIIESRVRSAEVLKSFFDQKGYKPECYIGASAIGIYGNSGQEKVTEEDAGNPNRFIVRSVMEWEDAHQQIAQMGIRTVVIRIGLVLARGSQLIRNMLLPARFGIYGYFGDGAQVQSWIHLDDLVNLFLMSAQDSGMEGIYNGVAPDPVSAKELAKALRRAFRPGIILPVPTLFLKILLGRAYQIMLDSCNASAGKALDAGATFQFGKIREAMDDLLR